MIRCCQAFRPLCNLDIHWDGSHGPPQGHAEYTHRYACAGRGLLVVRTTEIMGLLTAKPQGQGGLGDWSVNGAHQYSPVVSRRPTPQVCEWPAIAGLLLLEFCGAMLDPLTTSRATGKSLRVPSKRNRNHTYRLTTYGSTDPSTSLPPHFCHFFSRTPGLDDLQAYFDTGSGCGWWTGLNKVPEQEEAQGDAGHSVLHLHNLHA